MANIRIALKDIENIRLVNTYGRTSSEMMEEYKPDILMNLALYDMESKTTLTYLVAAGEDFGYLFSNEGIGFQKNSPKPYWTDHYDGSAYNFIAGAPTLLKNGQTYIDWGNKHSEYLEGTHKRSVLGFNDTHLILCTTDYPLSLEATAKTAKDLGMKYAVNLDGGGSQHLQEQDKMYRKSYRSNVSWLLIYKKKEVNELGIIQDFIPKNKRRTGKELKPTSLTIHSTGNAKSTAKNERDYLASESNTNSAGFHIVVDEKEAIQCIPFNEVAYHSGTETGNYSSIGLEICESGDREITLRNAIEVVANILDQYEWGIDKLKQHYDWNGKNCPAILRNTGRWNWFKEEVEKALEKKTCVKTTVTSQGKTYDAYIIDGTTYAPVRSLAEALGKTVNYDNQTKKVTIV